MRIVNNNIIPTWASWDCKIYEWPHINVVKIKNEFLGTGNVLKIQNLLHICSEHYETDKDSQTEKDKKDKKDEGKKKDDKTSNADTKKNTKDETGASSEEEEKKDGSHQGIAVVGIAAIAMGEDIGIEMALRAFNHLVSATLSC